MQAALTHGDRSIKADFSHTVFCSKEYSVGVSMMQCRHRAILVLPPTGRCTTTATGGGPASTTRWWARLWPLSGAVRPWMRIGRTPSRRTSASGRRRDGGNLPSKQMRGGGHTSVLHRCLEYGKRLLREIKKL